ncbi:type II toxin-antitoxin system Phd/YefM family antitoxin [Escherichia sp. SP-MK]
MPSIILSDTSASVSELKKNPMATVSAGEGYPVAILNRNQPAFYCVPAAFSNQFYQLLVIQGIKHSFIELSRDTVECWLIPVKNGIRTTEE